MKPGNFELNLNKSKFEHVTFSFQIIIEILMQNKYNNWANTEMVNLFSLFELLNFLMFQESP